MIKQERSTQLPPCPSSSVALPSSSSTTVSLSTFLLPLPHPPLSLLLPPSSERSHPSAQQPSQLPSSCRVPHPLVSRPKKELSSSFLLSFLRSKRRVEQVVPPLLHRQLRVLLPQLRSSLEILCSISLELARLLRQWISKR